MPNYAFDLIVLSRQNVCEIILEKSVVAVVRRWRPKWANFPPAAAAVSMKRVSN